MISGFVKLIRIQYHKTIQTLIKFIFYLYELSFLGKDTK